ncbi:MAG: DUF485 domain-containing protein [Chloroflexi bacterium]|nr:DUF485 domain-containing protein [Chloroflexota bacterium]
MAQHSSAPDEPIDQRKINIGVRMTILYSILYGGFVVLNVFRPALMGSRGLFGLNLAITYGLGLIVMAILFAVIYNSFFRPQRNGLTATKSQKKDHM